MKHFLRTRTFLLFLFFLYGGEGGQSFWMVGDNGFENVTYQHDWNVLVSHLTGENCITGYVTKHALMSIENQQKQSYNKIFV